MKHEHVAQAVYGPYPFSYSVSREENPSAHGCMMKIQRCICGAYQKVNVNGIHTEHGPWTIGDCSLISPYYAVPIPMYLCTNETMRLSRKITS